MNIDFGKNLLQYRLIMNLAKQIKASNPEKTLIVCRQEAYEQLKNEGKVD
jgi:hypothetical protein